MHDAFMEPLDDTLADYEERVRERESRTPVFKNYHRQAEHVLPSAGNFTTDFVLVVRAPLQLFVDAFKSVAQNSNFETCCGGDYTDAAIKAREKCFSKNDDIRFGTEWTGYLSFMIHYCCAKRVVTDTHLGVRTDSRYWKED